MIKFFKEIIASIKEGVEEAKQELEEEKKLENENANLEETSIEDIQKIPYNEAFGNALGAPFRTVIFGDWFTLFKSKEGAEDNYYPIHLHAFGEYPKLKEHQKDFTKLLKRDFKIVNEHSCFVVLSSFFDILSVSKNNTRLENIEGTQVGIPYSSLSEIKISAVLPCIISYIVTSATDVGYLNKKDALDILDRIIPFVKKYHNSWSEYGTSFIEGQTEVGLNNFVGNSILKKNIGYLNSKNGSPWNTITW
ncbi:DUF1266 domain-containing protein [Aquimarina algicola]|uniref:DUF1266 domain-containing protein n=1 Tax=Aquimarina algicola TaxID=2589995 RepID=A0A504IRX0_9FLAO|nr:DUF1266 domain-containing protein [Aquimarina algicola]TPN81217.1 DUF1266 domain-containing protein [Aquimarina algicola]